MAPAKGGEKDCSVINEVMTGEYTISIHKCIRGVSFKKHVRQAFKKSRNLP
jgi:large subunit ribosomal protein L31e